MVSDLLFFFFFFLDRVSLTFSIAVTDRKKEYILTWGLRIQSILGGQQKEQGGCHNTLVKDE